VSICSRSLASLDNSSRNRTFWRGYPNLMHSYGGFLERRGLNLTPLKSTFNAKHFMCRLSGLSRMVSAQFTFEMCIAAWNREKFTKKTLFWGLKVVQVIDVGTPGKLVSSACYLCLSRLAWERLQIDTDLLLIIHKLFMYDKQQVCVYLQPFSR